MSEIQSSRIAGITLRLAEDRDLAQVVDLDRLSFAPLSSNQKIDQEWFQGTVNLPDRNLFLAVEETSGQGIGSYVQLDLNLWFEQRLFPAIGIAAVAVAPHRRGQRVARLMLEHALATAREHHLPLMALYPFQHGFYRKLGWAWVERSHQYRVSTRDLPPISARSGDMLPYTSALQPALQAVYNQAAAVHNGWLQRHPWQWESKLKPASGREIYCYGEASELTGYLILQFAHLESLPRTLAVVVQEWVALTPHAYRGILGFLASLRDQVSTVVWNTYPEDPFPHLLKEQRCDPMLPSTSFEFGLVKRLGEVGGGFMWRLVDIKRAFELRSIRTGEPFGLRFQVVDPIFGERAIAAEFGDNHITCPEKPIAPTITISIEHLTELFCGVRRATDLLWTGELEFDGDPALLVRLDTAWQASSPFCWDFF